MLDQSHCWFTKLALVLFFCPVSTSNAPHSVLDTAMATAVIVKAGIMPPILSIVATHPNARKAATLAMMR